MSSKKFKGDFHYTDSDNEDDYNNSSMPSASWKSKSICKKNLCFLRKTLHFDFKTQRYGLAHHSHNTTTKKFKIDKAEFYRAENQQLNNYLLTYLL